LTTWRTLGLLLIGILFSVSGELMLKHGMNKVGTLSLNPTLFISSLVRTFTTPYVLAGFALVFCGSIFWLAVISRIQLSIAYPMLSLSYVIALLASWRLFGEQPTATKLVGVVIIVLGVVVISRA